MAGLIYKIIELIYGGGLTESVTKWMDALWNVLIIIFQNNDLIGSAYIVFAGISASLLVFFFYMEIASQASKDLLSLEKLVLFFIKYIISFAKSMAIVTDNIEEAIELSNNKAPEHLELCLKNAKEIMNGLLVIGQGVYEKAKDTSFSVDGAGNGTNYTWDYVIEKHTADGFDDQGRSIYVMNILDGLYGSSISGFFNGLSILIPGLLAYVVGFACNMICYFICTANVLNICVRGYASPLAIPQIFDEGQRSTGIRYFKSFMAAALEMGMIVIVLRLAGQISTALQPAIFGIIKEGASGVTGDGYLFVDGDIVTANLDFALSAIGLIPSLLPHLAAAGAIAGVNKITRDIVG